ncbi:Exocyst complex component 1 [Homalodisca vitripennis]|nr:Exocyst complex component 1 [Homalodisca vitripennis]
MWQTSYSLQECVGEWYGIDKMGGVCTLLRVKNNQFFDGVQVKVAQGVKESEISYQMAFSKQELRKVIREYPGREVRKGLNDLYKKVEKHLCEEENLLQEHHPSTPQAPQQQAPDPRPKTSTVLNTCDLRSKGDKPGQ